VSGGGFFALKGVLQDSNPRPPLKEYSIGALSLVVSRHVVYERAAGQDPVRKMDNGSPEVLESI
jgi:hypothetical protein